MAELNREKIRKEAEQILDKFSKALSKVKISKRKIEEKAGGYRDEGGGLKCDVDFRERMFDNAYKDDGEFIIAEAKTW